MAWPDVPSPVLWPDVACPQVNREFGALAEDFVALGLLPAGTSAERDAVVPALTGTRSCTHARTQPCPGSCACACAMSAFACCMPPSMLAPLMARHSLSCAHLA